MPALDADLSIRLKHILMLGGDRQTAGRMPALDADLSIRLKHILMLGGDRQIPACP